MLLVEYTQLRSPSCLPPTLTLTQYDPEDHEVPEYGAGDHEAEDDGPGDVGGVLHAERVLLRVSPAGRAGRRGRDRAPGCRGGRRGRAAVRGGRERRRRRRVGGDEGGGGRGGGRAGHRAALHLAGLKIDAWARTKVRPPLYFPANKWRKMRVRHDKGRRKRMFLPPPYSHGTFGQNYGTRARPFPLLFLLP